MKKIIDFIKKIIKKLLDMLIPKVNYVEADGNIVVTADYKIFNVREEE